MRHPVLSCIAVAMGAAVGTLAHGQSTNDQATIVVQEGARLIVEGVVLPGTTDPIEVGSLTVAGPGLPDGILNPGPGSIDTFVAGQVTWSFDTGLVENLLLGDLFPPGLVQADLDLLYTASYTPFGSTDVLPVALVVPAPASVSLLCGVALVASRRRR